MIRRDLGNFVYNLHLGGFGVVVRVVILLASIDGFARVRRRHPGRRGAG